MRGSLIKHTFSLLHVDYVKLGQKWNYTNVISPYYRIYYIDEGEGTISSAHEKLKLEAGYMYIIPSFTSCNLKCPGYLSQYFIHFFEDSPDGISLFEGNRNPLKLEVNERDVAHLKRLLQINPGRGINRSDNPKVYEKDVYYKEYQELNSQQSVAIYFETQGILMQLISRFLASKKYKQKSIRSIPSKILDAISYIHLNLKNELSVAQLAQRAYQHPDYFSRLFFQYTGGRPLHYIHEKRIERAQYLLTTTSLTFSEVAEETGFENLPYFSKIFKKVTNLTPGQYIKQNLSFTNFY